MTTERRLRAARMLKRMSKVRALRAAAVLVAATREERDRQSTLDGAEAACAAVAAASGECLVEGQHLDTARYDMLSRLGAALAQQHEQATSRLQEAAAQRLANAVESLRARRRNEHDDERAMALEHARARLHAARVNEDAVDLWLKHREQP